MARAKAVGDPPLPVKLLAQLDEWAEADGTTREAVLERLVDHERARRKPAVPPASPGVCAVCGKKIPAARRDRPTCSVRCARKHAAGTARWLVMDGVRRVSGHGKEAAAEAAATALRERSPHTAHHIHVVREEL